MKRYIVFVTNETWGNNYFIGIFSDLKIAEGVIKSQYQQFKDIDLKEYAPTFGYCFDAEAEPNEEDGELWSVRGFIIDDELLTPIDDNNKISTIINHYGHQQLYVAIEEMSELTKELIKNHRGRMNQSDIHEEIADVKLMIQQLEILYDCRKEVKEIMTKKIDRTINRIVKEQTNNGSR